MTSAALVVGCGKLKVWKAKPWLGAVPAKDVYIGPLFRLCRRYAEMHYASDWFILSAFYGLVVPEQELLDYDVTFNGLNSSVIDRDRLSKQSAALLDRYEVIVSLAGKAYNEQLRRALPSSKVLELPLQSKSLFERMKWLKAATTP
ncbi:MAG: hypothetical protein LAO76_02170 [Acidobacteriia bacterium]|nr:hypothetical protein [Terriglobia bacterium]